MARHLHLALARIARPLEGVYVGIILPQRTRVNQAFVRASRMACPAVFIFNGTVRGDGL